MKMMGETKMKHDEKILFRLEYTIPVCEIVRFGASDMITTSDALDAEDPEKVETEIDRLFGDPW